MLSIFPFCIGVVFHHTNKSYSSSTCWPNLLFISFLLPCDSPIPPDLAALCILFKKGHVNGLFSRFFSSLRVSFAVTHLSQRTCREHLLGLEREDDEKVHILAILWTLQANWMPLKNHTFWIQIRVDGREYLGQNLFL